MLRGMAGKRGRTQKTARPTIAIAGAGNLASVLAVALRRAGYKIESIIGRDARSSMARAQTLAKKIGSRADPIREAQISAEIVWLCVPDSEISSVARLLAKCIEADGKDWKGKTALHSSGALTSDELASLRQRGATVASVHPLMTFVKGSQASLAGVSFAIEGDTAAVRRARQIVRDLGGQSYAIRKQDKVAYHAWGTFASPLVTALLATSERVAAAAGVQAKDARRRMLPMVAQTIANYGALGAAKGFSGPIVRGEVEIVKRHLRGLRRVPEAREVYLALARAAMRYLRGKNPNTMRKLLSKP
jgi:predicted short-subunit dehydrogenase-like oxidoreductase (DUF2520 family)